jgi:urease gamma subunit
LVKGEPDTNPFTKLFEFRDEDEPIFHNIIEFVKAKISGNLKLNTHEALIIFCAYITSEIRSGKSESQIRENSSKILTRDSVLIGVPETLREIMFDINVDNLPKKIIRFIEPIPTANYIMADSGAIGVTNCEKKS